MEIEPPPWDYARALIRRHHYLGDIPKNCTRVFITAGAAAAYGPPHAPRLPSGYIELRRLVADGSLPGSLSSFLSATLRALKREGWRACLTWADPDAGHHGGIYQATNWIYAEPRSYSWNYSFRTPDGDIVGHRKAFTMFGSSSKKTVLSRMPDWEAFLPGMKLRYVMPLNARPDDCLRDLRAVRRDYPKPDRDGARRRPPMKQRQESLQ